MHPFRGSEVLRAGRLTRRQLQSRFTALYPDVYLPRETALDAVTRAQAAWLWSHRRGIVAGRSAAALHGAKWVEGKTPAALIYDNRHPPAGIVTWADAIAAAEVTMIGGIPVTTPARAMLDITCRYPRLVALTAVDALARAAGVPTADALLLADRYPGRRNIRRARKLLTLADAGSESPRETWLRLVLVDAGLPPPHTQIRVHDEFGQVVARLDMGWPDVMVAVEYDGDHHWTDRRQFARDIRRAELLRALGWTVIRVTAEDTPAGVVGRVHRALAAHPKAAHPEAARPDSLAPDGLAPDGLAPDSLARRA